MLLFCELLYLLLLLLLISRPTSATTRQQQEHVLIFGDSIDRIALYRYCDQAGVLYGEYSNIEWNVNMTVESMMSVHCETHRHHDILAFVHIFGAHPTGPYTHVVENEWTSTEMRITKALSIFQQKFNTLPSRVLFHTTKWEKGSPYLFDHIILPPSPTRTPTLPGDTEVLPEIPLKEPAAQDVAIKSKALETFEKWTKYWIQYFYNVSLTMSNINMHENENENERGNDNNRKREKRQHSSLKLILRTMPANSDYNLLESFNDVIRKMAYRLQFPFQHLNDNSHSSSVYHSDTNSHSHSHSSHFALYFYDMHEDLWWISNYDRKINEHMFMDETHPTAIFLIRYMEKVLGLRYSAHFQPFRSNYGVDFSSSPFNMALSTLRTDLCHGHDGSVTDLFKSSSSSLGTHPILLLEHILFQCPHLFISVLHVQTHSSPDYQHGSRTRRLRQERRTEEEELKSPGSVLYFTAVSPVDGHRYLWQGIDEDWMKSQLLTEGDILSIPFSLLEKWKKTHIPVHSEITSNSDEVSLSLYRGIFQESPAFTWLQFDGNFFRIPSSLSHDNQGSLPPPEQPHHTEQCLYRFPNCLLMTMVDMSQCDEINASMIKPDEVALLFWKFGPSNFLKLIQQDGGKLLTYLNGGMSFYAYVDTKLRWIGFDTNQTLAYEYLKNHGLSIPSSPQASADIVVHFLDMIQCFPSLPLR